MASLLDRLRHDTPPESGENIGVHYFYAALVGMADGQFTRTQIENRFNIGTTGEDEAQLDILINGYQAAADKQRYLNSVHAMFMLLETGETQLTNAQINAWLTAAQAAY